MTIYSAGGIQLKKLRDRHGSAIGKWPRLDSYFYVKQKDLDEHRRDWSSFFLDSGAFSAWSQKKEIDMVKYAEFIKRNGEAVNYVATLDDISDWRKTLENTKYLESLGVKVMPVFHYSEPWHVLEQLVAQYEYVALGGMVPISTKDLELWLPECFRRICRPDGIPKVKVHGFGLTTRSLVERFPWESVDSTSAVMSSATGTLLTPFGSSIDVGKSGIASLTDKMYIEERGWDLEELVREYVARQAFNIQSLGILEKKLTDSPPKFEFKQETFL